MRGGEDARDPGARSPSVCARCRRTRGEDICARQHSKKDVLQRIAVIPGLLAAAEGIFFFTLYTTRSPSGISAVVVGGRQTPPEMFVFVMRSQQDGFKPENNHFCHYLFDRPLFFF